METKKRLDTSRQELKSKEEEVKKNVNDFKTATVSLINAYEKEYNRNKKTAKTEVTNTSLNLNAADVEID